MQSSSKKRKKSSSAADGRKDKHSKVCTASGTTRDRRLRLSPNTAIQFYDVQDRLGYDRPSKAVDWLMNEAKSAIDALPPLPPPPPVDQTLPPHHDIYSFDCFPTTLSSSCCSEFQVLPIVVVDETPQQPDSVQLEHTYHHHQQAFYTWNHNNNNNAARSQFSDRETMFTAQREPLQSIHNYPIITPNYAPPFPGIIINHSSNSNQELLHHMPNSFLHFQD
ncbi:hypothetical protein ABFX02_13G099600 [Erythranthe guttata]